MLRLLQEARQKLEAERQRRSEPIAIVGMACRLPSGALSPDELWSLLVDRIDATSDVPRDRWDAEALYDPDPDAPGKAYTRRGAFLDRVDGFDPAMFGVSPREATAMDPQQRLLLEVTWEALENAGIPANGLKGSATGVWLGSCGDDYARRSLSGGNLELIDGYMALGNARSVAAGRIAYVFGLQGPVLQLDTACSSSLVAMHLAVRSLRAGECKMALAGGVNLMLSPEMTIALCKLNALARDGRCKTFDAAADGFGRGEGCGMVVLKRLSDARAAGDSVVAVIRGTAINHDGRSNGLAAPNGSAQESLIRAALLDAGVEPQQVGYVEVHGTGTPVGDAIEVNALSRVYEASGSRAGPLLLGSLKANIGHLEGAAGVASVIKVALCLRHERIPPQLHLRRPNPRIAWDELPVKVVTDELEWAPSGGTRLAAVSAFGISGTNAHVVLEQAPAVEAPAVGGERSAELFVLSAKTLPALRAQRLQLADHLERHPEQRLKEIAFSLLRSRATLDCRWAVAASSPSALVEALRSDAGGASVCAHELAPMRPKVAFVFPERGSRWLGMGRRLLEEETAFRDAMLAVDAAIRAEAGWSILSELSMPEERSKLARIEIWQPTLFSLQVSLAALWKAWGVAPDAVVGHGMGEVAAACVSGALSLQAAAATVCRSSGWLTRVHGQHGLALVEPSLRGARLALAGFEGALEPLLEDLVRALDDVRPKRAEVAMHSTVTGDLLTGSELTASYWAENLRHPVLFEQSIRALVDKGVTHFVEVSPHPLLTSSIDGIRRELGAPGVATGSLKRELPERLSLLNSLAILYVHGHPLDTASLFPEGAGRVGLPNYPWQRETFWLEAPFPRASAPRALLGTRSSSPLADAVFESVASLQGLAWLGEYRLRGERVLPPAALMEMLRVAAADFHAGASCDVSDLEFHAPLVIEASRGRRLQVVLSAAGTRAGIYGRAAHSSAADGWTLHASATLEVTSDRRPERLDVLAVRARCTRLLDIENVYSDLALAGFERKPAFRVLRSLSVGSREAFAEVALAPGLEASKPASLACDPARQLGLHPALIDAALLAAHRTLDLHIAKEPWLLVSVDRYVLHRFDAASLVVHVQARAAAASDGGSAVDMTLAEPTGAIVARIFGVHLGQSESAAAPLAHATNPATADDLAGVSSHRRLLDGSKSPFAARELALSECLNPLGTPRARLFGFHDAGGSASLFEPFCRALGDDIEVHTISNARRFDPRLPLSDAMGQRYLDEVASYIRAKSDAPSVLFGHSLGALFAWRVLKELQRSRVQLPRLLFLSAAATPGALERARTPEGLSEIFDRLIGDRWKGVKNLRAGFDSDFALWSALPEADSDPVDTEIVAFAGRGDVIAGEQAMRAWRQATTGAFSLRELPGGHFYIYGEAARAAMLEMLRETMRRL